MTTIQNTTFANPQKQCFSYIRFSSRQQAKGDSLRRQMEIAPRVAEKKGWLLREDLCAKNLGVSAFKGSNLETIRGIIAAAKAGHIPQGTVMIIEAFDRFSRADIDTAEDAMKDTLRAGLEIYVDRGEHHLTRESLSKPIDRIIALLELAQANEFSAKLSDRCGKAWRKKKTRAADGLVMGKMVPAWLDADSKNNTIKPNEKAETVKRIFTSYADGKGVRTIMRELNREGVPPFGKGGQNKGKAWSSTHIRRILSFRGVIGEYQPCVYVMENDKRKRIEDGQPISDYYPAVIEKSLFYKVQNMLEKTLIDPKTGKAFNRRPSGPKQNATNLFTKIVKCPHCNGSMVIKQSGLHRGKYDYTSLVCYNAARGKGCKYHTIQYSQVERAVLTLIFYKVVPAMTGTNGKQEKLTALKGDLEHAKKQLAKWTAIVNASEVPSETAAKQLNLFETRRAALGRQIEAVEATLDDNPLFAWRAVLNTPENRMRLQTVLADEIESLTVDAASRKAKLVMKSPRVEFDISWPQSVGSNATRPNPAEYGFSCDGETMVYREIWNSLNLPALTAEDIQLSGAKYLSGRVPVVAAV